MKRPITLLLTVLVASSYTFPCTCVTPDAKTMREMAELYAAQPGVALIFQGKVVKEVLHAGSVGAPSNAISTTYSAIYETLSFDEVTVYRGKPQEHISLVTGSGMGDCGYSFETGHEYLVYATESAGVWYTSLCSGTSAVEDAGAAIRFFTGQKATAEDLLSPEEYAKYFYEKVLPARTGSICGHVLKPDGSPLKDANVTLWELRTDGLPPREASDQNLSDGNGGFCVLHAPPGRYILTAESTDLDHDFRYMAFYPGVYSESGAISLEMKAGVKAPEVAFKTLQQPLYMIHIRVTTPDGTQLSYENGCYVRIDSSDRNPLSYRMPSFSLKKVEGARARFVPPGKYVVTAYFEPDISSDPPKPFPEAGKWRTTRKEVTVVKDADVLIQMEPTAEH